MLLALGALTVLVALHTAVATVLIRFFRVRLETAWGSAMFVVVFVPVVLTISLLVVGQAPVFVALGRDTVLLVGILFPLLLGATVDRFWLPAPDEVAIETHRGKRSP